MIGFDIFAKELPSTGVIEVSVKGGVVTDFQDSKPEIVCCVHARFTDRCIIYCKTFYISLVLI